MAGCLAEARYHHAMTIKRMTRLSTRRASAEQFAAVLPHLTSIADKRIEQARLAIVDGVQLNEIAEQAGVSPNAISKLVRQVWETMQRENIIAPEEGEEVLPPGWERVTMVAPKEFIERMKSELAAHVRASTKKRNQEPA